MLKTLTGVAAAGMLMAFAVATPADAASKRDAGITEHQQMTDVSAGRRHRHWRRHHVYHHPRVYRRVYAGYPYYRYRPYRPYYYPYSYYRPYRPAIYAGFGPIGFGFGGGWGPGWYW